MYSPQEMYKTPNLSIGYLFKVSLECIFLAWPEASQSVELHKEPANKLKSSREVDKNPRLQPLLRKVYLLSISYISVLDNLLRKNNIIFIQKRQQIERCMQQEFDYSKE